MIARLIVLAAVAAALTLPSSAGAQVDVQSLPGDPPGKAMTPFQTQIAVPAGAQQVSFSLAAAFTDVTVETVTVYCRMVPGAIPIPQLVTSVDAISQPHYLAVHLLGTAQNPGPNIALWMGTFPVRVRSQRSVGLSTTVDVEGGPAHLSLKGACFITVSGYGTLPSP